MDIAELLAFSVKNKASDLHLSAGLPPMIRVDGDVRRINIPALEHKQVHSLVYDIMSDKQRRDYEEFLEVDFSFEIPGLARFRVNAFNQNRGAGAVFRTIPSEVLTLEDLGCPRIFKELIDQPQGLILVHRPDRLGQIDDARGDGRSRQQERIRPHPHDRGSDRVRAHLAEVPDQPARSASRHARLQRSAALGAARRSRLHPGRRNARHRNDPPRADRRGNRTSGVRDAAHDVGGQDHRPHHRRVPGRRKADGAFDAVRIAARGDLAVAAEEESAAGASRRTRSWSAFRRSAT